MKVVDSVSFEHNGNNYKLEKYLDCSKSVFFAYILVGTSFVRLSFQDFMNVYFFTDQE